MGRRSGKMLAVGWIDSARIENGDPLEIQVLQKTYSATVASDPVYDPSNEKLLG